MKGGDTMKKCELDFLYETVVSASNTSTNPLREDISKAESQLEREIMNLAINDNSDYSNLDYEELKAFIYDLCDLYAKDAFAKGIAFANNLNKQVAAHRNTDITA